MTGLTYKPTIRYMSPFWIELLIQWYIFSRHCPNKMLGIRQAKDRAPPGRSSCTGRTVGGKPRPPGTGGLRKNSEGGDHGPPQPGGRIHQPSKASKGRPQSAERGAGALPACPGESQCLPIQPRTQSLPRSSRWFPRRCTGQAILSRRQATAQRVLLGKARLVIAKNSGSCLSNRKYTLITLFYYVKANKQLE